MADSAAPEVVSTNHETPNSNGNPSENAAQNAPQPTTGQETASTSQQSAAANIPAAPTQQEQPQPPIPPPQAQQPAAVQIDVNQMANVISVSYLAANGLNNQRNRGGGVAGVNIGVGAPGQVNV